MCPPALRFWPLLNLHWTCVRRGARLCRLAEKIGTATGTRRESRGADVRGG